MSISAVSSFLTGFTERFWQDEGLSTTGFAGIAPLLNVDVLEVTGAKCSTTSVRKASPRGQRYTAT